MRQEDLRQEQRWGLATGSQKMGTAVATSVGRAEVWDPAGPTENRGPLARTGRQALDARGLARRREGEPGVAAGRCSRAASAPPRRRKPGNQGHERKGRLGQPVPRRASQGNGCPGPRVAGAVRVSGAPPGLQTRRSRLQRPPTRHQRARYPPIHLLPYLPYLTYNKIKRVRTVA